VKPAPLEYRRARSAAEAIELVQSSAGQAKFLAGGQTLGPMINLRLAQPDLLVDVSRLPELLQVKREGEHLLVGAATPHAAFEDGIVPDVANGFLARAASGIAYRSVRNRGTIGGSLAHADPASDWPTALLALDASVIVAGAKGRREIPLTRFLTGAMTTALGDDELIESVRIPCLARGARWGYYKRCRKLGEFAYSMAAVVVDRERAFCRAVIGATGGAPLLLERTARILAATGGWLPGIEAEIRASYEADLAASGMMLDEYDRHVHGVSIIRAAKDALQ